MTSVLDGPTRQTLTLYPEGKPPNARQELAHGTEADELFYGGAAGGGKTDYVIAEVLAVLFEFPGASAAMFRRTYPELTGLGGVELRLVDRIPPAIGSYNRGHHLWTFANGSRLELGHCQRDADVAKYQGREWQVLAFDQLEQFTEYQYRFLLHRLRVSGRVADSMAAAGYVPKAISTGNPGGVGHGWVKSRFIDAHPLGETPFVAEPSEDEPSPGLRVFIPAKVEDNAANLDEGYIPRLRRLPPDTRRAMLEGDWNVYVGQRFREFRTDVHVVEPEALPIPLGGQVRAVGIDYGFDAPFCALWGVKLPDEGVLVYRELYASGLTPAEQARAVLMAEAPGERDPHGRPIPAALDPSCWARDPNVKGPVKPANPNLPPPGSIAARYRAEGVPVERAQNDRLAGVALVADKLRPRGDGWPRLLIYSTCRNLIRTVPGLIRDPRRPEDVDTHGEDHAYDALRYLLMRLAKAPPAGSRAEPPPGRRLSRPTTGPTVTGRLRRQGF